MKWTDTLEAALHKAVRENPTATWAAIGKIIGVPREPARCAAKRFGIEKDKASRWNSDGGHYTDRRCNVEAEIENDDLAERRHREADDRFVARIHERLAA